MMARMLNLRNQVKTGHNRNCRVMMGRMMDVVMYRMVDLGIGSVNAGINTGIKGRLKGRMIGGVGIAGSQVIMLVIAGVVFGPF